MLARRSIIERSASLKSMSSVQRDLIYDVGLHNGDDTAYYLAKGFRVVAIEANPVLAERCFRRFRSEVDAGQVHILNVGVGPVRGEFDFWVHKTHDEWSSFIRNPDWNSDECERIRIDTVPLTEILEEHGTPYYLKVDIEGADVLAIRALDGLHLPTYVSFEGSPEAVTNLCHLSCLGYDAFKIVDQSVHNHPQTALEHDNENDWKRIRGKLVLWKWRVTRQFRLDETLPGRVWRSLRRGAPRGRGVRGRCRPT